MSRGPSEPSAADLVRRVLLGVTEGLSSPSPAWNVRRILDWTIGYLSEHGSESPRLEAEVLLAHACGWPRIQLYTRFEEELPEDVRARMRGLVTRRAASEPVAYLVGYREFFSLRFDVGPGVFIPRPETETLVVEALERLKGSVPGPHAPPRRVLDLCTGSGCVGIAIAANARDVQLVGVDQNPAALDVARRNAERQRLGDRAQFIESDLFEDLSADDVFELIVGNPPYVAVNEAGRLPADVRNFEPAEALFAGGDGLDVIRRIAADAPSRLRPGGGLLLELSPEQAHAAAAIFDAAGLRDVAPVKDLAGDVRVMTGRRADD